MKQKTRLAYPGGPDYSKDSTWLGDSVPDGVPQNFETLVFRPRGGIVFGAACPVDPGTERANRTRLRPLLRPGRNGRMAIDPRSNLIGIAEIHLAIVNVHSGIARSNADPTLPDFDLLVRVGMSTEHDVVAAGFERSADHWLDHTASAHDIVRCGSRRYLPCLDLELAEPRGQERSMRGAAGPRDAPVLTTVRSGNAARDVNAVLGQPCTWASALSNLRRSNGKVDPLAARCARPSPRKGERSLRKRTHAPHPSRKRLHRGWPRARATA